LGLGFGWVLEFGEVLHFEFVLCCSLQFIIQPLGEFFKFSPEFFILILQRGIVLNDAGGIVGVLPRNIIDRLEGLKINGVECRDVVGVVEGVVFGELAFEGAAGSG
jgi:hypothetical protein